MKQTWNRTKGTWRCLVDNLSVRDSSREDREDVRDVNINYERAEFWQVAFSSETRRDPETSGGSPRQLRDDVYTLLAGNRCSTKKLHNEQSDFGGQIRVMVQGLENTADRLCQVETHSSIGELLLHKKRIYSEIMLGLAASSRWASCRAVPIGELPSCSIGPLWTSMFARSFPLCMIATQLNIYLLSYNRCFPNMQYIWNSKILPHLFSSFWP